MLDKAGAEVVGAQVSLQSKGFENQQTTTGSDGQFSFPDVPPGELQVTVTATGFAPQTYTGTLSAGQFLIVPAITLVPKSANTAVEVVASQYEIAEAQIKEQEQQRIVGVFPNFWVSYIPDAAPLTSKQKFKLASRAMIDPVEILVTAATAGVEQSQNTYSAYGQGAQGYAKRLGAAYLDDATDTFIGGAILPSLFHQDPRFFYKGTGSVRSRLLYAAGTVFVSKGDNKRWQPNYSGILGSLASGGISNLYHPAEDRGASLVFTNTAIGMGSAAIENILQEFVIKRFTPKARKQNP